MIEFECGFIESDKIILKLIRAKHFLKIIFYLLRKDQINKWKCFSFVF